MRIRAFVCTGLGAIDTRRAVCLKGNLYAPEKKTRGRARARATGDFTRRAPGASSHFIVFARACVYVRFAMRRMRLARRVRQGCKRVQIAEHREETKHYSPSFD